MDREEIKLDGAEEQMDARLKKVDKNIADVLHLIKWPQLTEGAPDIFKKKEEEHNAKMTAMASQLRAEMAGFQKMGLSEDSQGEIARLEEASGQLKAEHEEFTKEMTQMADGFTAEIDGEKVTLVLHKNFKPIGRVALPAGAQLADSFGSSVTIHYDGLEGGFTLNGFQGGGVLGETFGDGELWKAYNVSMRRIGGRNFVMDLVKKKGEGESVTQPEENEGVETKNVIRDFNRKKRWQVVDMLKGAKREVTVTFGPRVLIEEGKAPFLRLTYNGLEGAVALGNPNRQNKNQPFEFGVVEDDELWHKYKLVFKPTGDSNTYRLDIVKK